MRRGGSSGAGARNCASACFMSSRFAAPMSARRGFTGSGMRYKRNTIASGSHAPATLRAAAWLFDEPARRAQDAVGVLSGRFIRRAPGQHEPLILRSRRAAGCNHAVAARFRYRGLETLHRALHVGELQRALPSRQLHTARAELPGDARRNAVELAFALEFRGTRTGRIVTWCHREVPPA